MDKQQKQIFQFNYYKENFWNNMDFTDERILRTPIFFNKMDTYLNKLTVQDPDSIKKSRYFSKTFQTKKRYFPICSILYYIYL